MDAGRATAAVPPKKGIRFDASYIIRRDGIVKLLKMIFNLAGFLVCYIYMQFSYNYLPWKTLISFFAVNAIVPAILFVMYLFHILEMKKGNQPWIVIEYFYECCTIMSFIGIALYVIFVYHQIGLNDVYYLYFLFTHGRPMFKHYSFIYILICYRCAHFLSFYNFLVLKRIATYGVDYFN